MEQGLSGLFLDISDGSFGNSILEVGIYSTVGEKLLVVFTVTDECIFCKATIICVVLLDYHYAANFSKAIFAWI